MKTIRVKFIQIWQDLNPNDNFLLDILKHKYNVIIDNVNYDYLFGGGQTSPGKKSIRICGEPHSVKNIGDCDYIITQYYVPEDPRYIRIPLYIHYVYNYIKQGSIDSMDWFFRKRNFDKNLLLQKKNFCAFVHTGTAGNFSNQMYEVFNGIEMHSFFTPQYRDQFMLKLSKYKKVDCLGSRGNNTNRIPWAGDNGIQNSVIKRDIIKNYKFCFSFENTTTKDGYMGYTSEKITDPMVANTLPLYWGNVLIDQEFNTKSFINWYDYKNDEEMIDRIIEIDNNDDLYLEYMNEPLSIHNDNLNMDFLISQMEKIIEG